MNYKPYNIFLTKYVNHNGTCSFHYEKSDMEPVGICQ
jgi:hypothetical protein